MTRQLSQRIRNFRYAQTLKRKFKCEDNSDDEASQPSKSKLDVLNNCEVAIKEEMKMTEEDYSNLKESARKEFAKKTSASSRNQIIYCLKASFENR